MAEARRLDAFQDVGESEVIDQTGVQPPEDLGSDRFPQRAAAERQKGDANGEAQPVAR